MSNKKLQERLISIAMDLKPLKNEGSHFLVAFAIVRGRLRSVGLNSYSKTDTVNKDYINRDGSKTSYRHAESNLIKKLRKLYLPNSNVNIYIVRITQGNKVRLAKPCINCAYLLGQFNPKNIYYTNDVGRFEKLYGSES